MAHGTFSSQTSRRTILFLPTTWRAQGAEKAPATYPGNIENVAKLTDEVLEASEKAKEATEKGVDFYEDEVKNAESKEEDRKKAMSDWLSEHDREAEPDEAEAKELASTVSGASNSDLNCDCAEELYGPGTSLLQRPRKCHCSRKKDKVAEWLKLYR